MFHSRPHASNVVLVQLQQALRHGGFELFDVQLSNPHLERFGCFCISDAAYSAQLQAAVRSPAVLELNQFTIHSRAWMSR